MVEKKGRPTPRAKSDVTQLLLKLHDAIGEVKNPRQDERDGQSRGSGVDNEPLDSLLDWTELYYTLVDKAPDITPSLGAIGRILGALERLTTVSAVQDYFAGAGSWEGGANEAATSLGAFVQKIRESLQSRKNVPPEMIKFLDKCEKIDGLSQQIEMGSREGPVRS